MLKDQDSGSDRLHFVRDHPDGVDWDEYPAGRNAPFSRDTKERFRPGAKVRVVGFRCAVGNGQPDRRLWSTFLQAETAEED